MAGSGDAESLESSRDIAPEAVDQASCQPTTEPELHDIQLRYKVAAPTFKTLCMMPRSPDRREVLHRACMAIEFRSFPMRQAERAFFREINDHSPIPYPVRENVSEPWHKVFLLVQVDLQKMGWPKKISADTRRSLHQERGRIYTLLDRLLRCVADILGQRRDGRGVNVALDVLRSVDAGVWEGSDKELLQVSGIGPAKMDRLVKAGIKSVKQLARLEFYHIERLLSRNPPFGHEMLHRLSGFPRLRLRFELVGEHPAPPTAGSAAPGQPLLIARLVLGYENDDKPSWNEKAPWTTLVIEGESGKLLWFWRGSVRRLDGGKELVVGLAARKGEQLKVAFACEKVVGTMIRSSHEA
ncbi:hypothetical protein CDD83_8064 [Cordyceps sp. RAO-2017]|nr:hypothetical protein CDD83_8064 [Cordyceps sp. RAO-2017]